MQAGFLHMGQIQWGFIRPLKKNTSLPHHSAQSELMCLGEEMSWVKKWGRRTLTGGVWFKRQRWRSLSAKSFSLGNPLGGIQEVELGGGQWPLDTPGQEAGHVFMCVCVIPVILMDASYWCGLYGLQLQHIAFICHAVIDLLALKTKISHSPTFQVLSRTKVGRHVTLIHISVITPKIKPFFGRSLCSTRSQCDSFLMLNFLFCLQLLFSCCWNCFYNSVSKHWLEIKTIPTCNDLFLYLKCLTSRLVSLYLTFCPRKLNKTRLSLISSLKVWRCRSQSHVHRF